jgi:hypothetical protein
MFVCVKHLPVEGGSRVSPTVYFLALRRIVRDVY